MPPLIQVVDFAKEFYHKGPEGFVGGRVEIDGKLYTHGDTKGLQGGFSAKLIKTRGTSPLDDAWNRELRKSAQEMFTRIDRLDNNSEKMRDLASQMAAKIRSATGVGSNWMDAATLLTKSDELFEKWKTDVDGLSSTQ